MDQLDGMEFMNSIPSIWVRVEVLKCWRTKNHISYFPSPRSLVLYFCIILYQAFVFEFLYFCISIKMAHKGVSSLFCLLDILIWAHSLSVGDKATQSEKRLDTCFSFILSLKKQQLCLTRFSSVVSYKAKASQRLAGPRVKSSGHDSVWAGTV